MMKLCLPLLLCTTFAGADTLTDWKTKVDAVLAPQLQHHTQIGVVVGVIDHGKQAIWTYGEATDGHAPDARTVFEIGSLTKTFTGLALGVLNDRGIVSLDDKVEKYLGELQGTAAGAVSLRQLSTHTSGMPRLPQDMALPPFDRADPYSLYTAERAFAWLHDLAIKPVALFDDKNYSNLGVALLGTALTRAAKAGDFAQLLQSTVLDPLQLNETTLVATPDQLAHAATPHDETTGAVSPWHFSDFWQGAGALHADIRQLLRYARAQLHPETTPIAAAITASHQRQAHGSTHDIGLGWILDGDRVWHNGETGGFVSVLELHPKADQAVVVLSNITVPALCVPEAVFDRPCTVNLGIFLDADQVQARVGTYRFAGNIRLEVTGRGEFLVGELFVGDQQAGRFRLFSRDTTDFFDAQHTVGVHFNEEHGQIVSVLLSAQGQQAIGVKQPKGVR